MTPEQAKQLQANVDRNKTKHVAIPLIHEGNIDTSKVRYDKMPNGIYKISYPDTIEMTKLSLKLFGIPMAKQSVRSTKTGHHYQPKDTVDRKENYINQIIEQLPKGFVPFEKEIHVTKFHCIYPPLKAFHKIKGRMDAIRDGKVFYKNTQPDLIDNLKKLVFDSMANIVFKNDGLIVTENNTAKYYGIGGAIIIEMEGY